VSVSNDTGLFHLIYEIKAEEQAAAAAAKAAVFIANSPKQEEFLEENIEEYSALENDYPEDGNTKMDLHGPDIASKKTSAGKAGDAISE
jgi:hypothetical protein